MGTFVSQPLGAHARAAGRAGAALGVILAAVYMLSVVQKMFFGPLTNPKNKRLKDLNARETLALAPLVALVFVIGLFPSIFLEPDEGRGERRARLATRRAARPGSDMGPEGTRAELLPRRGGPLEIGYPKSPEEREAEEPAKRRR